MSEQVWLSIDENTSIGVPVGTPWWDEEGKSVVEPCGFYVFAWLPRRCRNGKVRWLCWLERHRDGTYTKSR